MLPSSNQPPEAGDEFVMVIVPPDWPTVMPVPAAIVAVPPPAPPAVARVSIPVVVPDTVSAWASFVTEPSTSVAVKVIEPPFALVLSVMPSMPAALTVTAFAPDVVDSKVEEVPEPAPTPKTPSFVVEPSTSVAVTVTAPPVWLIAAIPAPVIDHEPPPLESVFV